MLSNEYSVENVGLDEYDDLIDHMNNTCNRNNNISFKSKKIIRLYI